MHFTQLFKETEYPESLGYNTSPPSSWAGFESCPFTRRCDAKDCHCLEEPALPCVCPLSLPRLKDGECAWGVSAKVEWIPQASDIAVTHLYAPKIALNIYFPAESRPSYRLMKPDQISTLGTYLRYCF